MDIHMVRPDYPMKDSNILRVIGKATTLKKLKYNAISRNHFLMCRRTAGHSILFVTKCLQKIELTSI